MGGRILGGWEGGGGGEREKKRRLLQMLKLESFSSENSLRSLSTFMSRKYTMYIEIIIMYI